ncbi:MAG: ThiF family adenylyltransferase, partial [Lewinella sp.]
MADNRYARQTVLPEVGAQGQEKLAAARVVIVGCGGLGSPAAAYLAGAGVGFMRLIDGDRPDTTNLHRQVFYDATSGESKVEQLRLHIERLNPDVRVNTVDRYLTAGTVRVLLQGAHLVLD